MPYTNFPNGLTSMGVPLPSAPLYPANGRTHYFIRASLGYDQPRGNDGNDGKSWDAPLLTMARAFQLVKSGDVIHFTGNIREQVTTPAGVFDVTIVGEGTNPRNADAHTNDGGFYAATWKGPAVPAAATPLVKVLQQGWQFSNILFNPPADAAAIQLYRDAGAGDLERDASHAIVEGCRFTGGQDGIQNIECAFVIVRGNLFTLHTGSAIKSSAGAGVALPYESRIYDNWFMDNANHIIYAANYGFIQRNYLGKFTTKGIDLSAGAGQYNVIYNNYLSGTYSIVGGYKKANANDDWGGNWNSGVGILTAAAPA